MPPNLPRIRRLLPRGLKILLRKWLEFPQKLFFSPYRIEKKKEGVAFSFWIADPCAKRWYDRRGEGDAWLEMAFIRDHVIRPGDVVFDCGAHHGYASILFSRWVGEGGTVYAFEPAPSNVAVIEKNVQLNALNNVKIELSALGAKAGTALLSKESNAQIRPGSGGIDVPVVPIDDYEHLNPTVLKIDVEGFELEVMRGARQVLARMPRLAIEIHPEALSGYGGSVEELFESIDVDAYKFWVQWRDDEIPKPYFFDEPIASRVHCFAIPKRESQ